MTNAYEITFSVGGLATDTATIEASSIAAAKRKAADMAYPDLRGNTVEIFENGVLLARTIQKDAWKLSRWTMV